MGAAFFPGRSVSNMYRWATSVEPDPLLGYVDTLKIVTTKTYPNLLWGVLLWEDLTLDKLCQYYAGSPLGGELFWEATSALLEAKKKGGKAAKQAKTAWPMGTVIGIKTMWRAPDFTESLAPLPVKHPRWPIAPQLFGGGVGMLNPAEIYNISPEGFTCKLSIQGVYYNKVGVSFPRNGDAIYIQYVVSEEKFGLPICAYGHRETPKGPSPYTIELEVFLPGHPDIDKPLAEGTYKLYHQKKINAEIYPADGTVLLPGSQVLIRSCPRADRTLTEFTVNGVDKLAEATENQAGPSFPGIQIPPALDDPKSAVYIHGPVNSDVYVTAVAEGVEIEETVKAGIEQTIQMTTTDCFADENSWSIVGTDLPGSTEYSIDANGLISLFIPEDVYEGNPGGVYYLDVEFHGYSQEKSMRLWLTVEEVAAYGTVWNEAASLPEIPAAVFEDSNQNLYVTTPTKILLSADAETFEEMTLTGTRTGLFGNVVEGPNGRLLVAEANGRIWIKDPEDEGFTRQDGWDAATSYWNFEPVWLSAHPLSDVFLQGGTSWHGLQQRITARHTTTGDVLHVLEDGGIYEGHANPGVLLPDGSWLITYPGSNYKVYRYTPGVGFAELISGTAGESENLLFREASGKVILLGGKTTTEGFIRSTENNGQTWSSETLVPKGFYERIDTVCSLKKDTLVFGGSNGQIHRSTDLITSYTTVKTIFGVVNWILKRRSGVLIALGGTASNVNVWKSEA